MDVVFILAIISLCTCVLLSFGRWSFACSFNANDVQLIKSLNRLQNQIIRLVFISFACVQSRLVRLFLPLHFGRLAFHSFLKSPIFCIKIHIWKEARQKSDWTVCTLFWLKTVHHNPYNFLANANQQEQQNTNNKSAITMVRRFANSRQQISAPAIQPAWVQQQQCSWMHTNDK